jgi:ribonuclease P protein component
LPLFALPKTSLLTKPWEYKQVYAHGKRLRGNQFSLVYLPNQLGENRLGISVHGEKSAVRRNRIKRIIREFFRQHRSFTQWGITGPKRPDSGLDVVFAIRREFSPESPQAVERALRDLLAKTPFEVQPPQDERRGADKTAAGRRRS